jgi:hypothetical protein
MTGRTCVGCGIALTKDVITREHIVPQWLAEELHLPGMSYEHYRHDEDTAENALVRLHDLGNFAINNVCGSCNNGWMSALEGRARLTTLALLNMKATVLQTTEDERATLAAWAVKIAYIASTQPGNSGLPWDLFRGLAETPERTPDECPILAGQLDFLNRLRRLMECHALIRLHGVRDACHSGLQSAWTTSDCGLRPLCFSIDCCRFKD